MTAVKTETVTFRIHPEIKTALRQMATNKHRSLANMVEVMIRNYRRRHPIIKNEALNQVFLYWRKLKGIIDIVQVDAIENHAFRPPMATDLKVKSGTKDRAFGPDVSRSHIWSLLVRRLSRLNVRLQVED